LTRGFEMSRSCVALIRPNVTLPLTRMIVTSPPGSGSSLGGKARGKQPGGALNGAVGAPTARRAAGHGPAIAGRSPPRSGGLPRQILSIRLANSRLYRPAERRLAALSTSTLARNDPGVLARSDPPTLCGVAMRLGAPRMRLAGRVTGTDPAGSCFGGRSLVRANKRYASSLARANTQQTTNPTGTTTRSATTAMSVPFACTQLVAIPYN